MAVQFLDSFGKYGPVGTVLVSGGTGYPAWVGGFNPNWNFYASNIGSNNLSIVAGSFSGSTALRYWIPGAGPFNPYYIQLGKTNLPAMSRMIVGFRYRTQSIGGNMWQGVTLLDGTASQATLSINGSGQLEVKRGYQDGTVLATSALTLLTNEWNYLEFDVTIHNTTGSYAVYLNGVAVPGLSATGVNTRGGSTNNQGTGFLFTAHGPYSGAYPVWDVNLSDIYVFDGTGTTNNVPRGDSRVETLRPVSDSSVAWSVGASVLGDQGGLLQGSTGTNAPGANQLALRKYTAEGSGNLASVAIYPAATSAAAKFKAVVYADNGSGTGVTGAPIATGSEVTGCTANTTLVLPFSSPPALTAGTIYWIGYITDTSVALNQSDGDALGYKAANTYTNGPPTGPSLTSGQPSWNLWGNMTGVTGANWSAVNSAGLGDNSYLLGNALDLEDLFGFSAISGTPTSIGAVAVTCVSKKTDAGARTLDLRANQGGAGTSGSTTGNILNTSYARYQSYFDKDPQTGLAWTYSGVNSAKYGVKVSL